MENLIGIARLAASGAVLEEKRRVEYRTLPTRKWLNRCDSRRVPFHWTINPYRGCEFGCKYCYARYTHEFMERRNPEAFETEIYAKDWNARSFAAELRAIKPGQSVGVGTATDPYQPAERRFGRTREVLEALGAVRGAAVFITTKSNLVVRDVIQLRRLAESNSVHVTLTVTTLDTNLARLMEPFAPRPELRLKAVRELSAAGVPVGVIASPVLPFLTDSEENLASVAKAAKAAGADHFGASVLFLKPCAQRVFFPFLAERFPEYLHRYEQMFADSAYMNGSYCRRLRELTERIRQRTGIPARDLLRVQPPQPLDAQMSLF
ncbi:MAG: radical SAM protein [Candidatus Acidiferrales bacterium]